MGKLDNTDEKIRIVENMRQFGGSFVKALAECIIRADGDNLQKIEFAFGEYIKKYSLDMWNKFNKKGV